MAGNRKIASYLKNKYVIATLAFVIWICFFDKNDLITQYQLTSQLHKLEEKKDYYQTEISKTEKERQELISSPQKLEKFAREKYLMKKDDEDLFIIDQSPGKKD